MNSDRKIASKDVTRVSSGKGYGSNGFIPNAPKLTAIHPPNQKKCNPANHTLPAADAILSAHRSPADRFANADASSSQTARMFFAEAEVVVGLGPVPRPPWVVAPGSKCTSSRQEDYQQDDQQNAQSSTGIVAPVGTVRPGRQET